MGLSFHGLGQPVGAKMEHLLTWDFALVEKD